jgi:hypothetical protein
LIRAAGYCNDPSDHLITAICKAIEDEIDW